MDTYGAKPFDEQVNAMVRRLADVIELDSAEAVRVLGELCAPGPAGLMWQLRVARKVACHAAVAEHGSQLAVAERTGLSAPTISQLMMDGPRRR
jgi:hypothetical protein